MSDPASHDPGKRGSAGTVPIRYLEPLRRALERMKAHLFRPFEPLSWIVLGFVCWLARLGSGGGGSHGGVSTDASGATVGLPGTSFGVQPSGWRESFEAFTVVGAVAGFVVFLVCFVIVVALVLAWLSARAEFVFLDDVVHRRALLVAPWSEYRREGNSLFLWRVGLFLVTLVGMLILGALVVGSATGFAVEELWGVSLAVLISLGTLFFAAIVVLLYVLLFLRSFVVPIMARYRVTATEAWRRFGPLFKRHPAELILYGLFVLALWIGVGVSILALSIATCCILAIPLVIPVVGTIVLLPVHVTLRNFSLEWLAQLDPDLDLLGPMPPPAPALAAKDAAAAAAPDPPDKAS